MKESRRHDPSRRNRKKMLWQAKRLRHEIEKLHAEITRYQTNVRYMVRHSCTLINRILSEFGEDGRRRR